MKGKLTPENAADCLFLDCQLCTYNKPGVDCPEFNLTDKVKADMPPQRPSPDQCP